MAATAIPILQEADFRRELKGSPRPGYLLFGDEDYLKAYAVRLAREVICPDPTFSAFNEMRIDALDFDTQKLMDALMPLPMMADKKLIVLSGLNFTAMKKSDFEDFCAVLGTLNDYDYNLLLVVVQSDGLDAGRLPNSPSPMLRQLAESLMPVQFDHPTDRKLAEWVGKHFAHNGVSASPALCASMLEFCGHSMFALANEIDKLSFYTLSGGRSEATDTDMRKVCTSAVEYDAFAFANALMDANRELALAILADYKFRRIDPIMILGNITRVFCDMEQIYALQKSGLPASSIASAMKMKEYPVRLYLQSLNRSNPERLRRAMEACAAADATLKLSPQGYTALEVLVCSV